MASTCDPREISLKSVFLGPQAENGPWVKELIDTVFDRWFDWRRSLFPGDGTAISIRDQETNEFIARKRAFAHSVNELMERFEEEMPKFSPRYIGHMVSEISLPALFGHIITLLHNPNNISGESSRIGVKIEDEAIEALLEMMGYPVAEGAGHFTSGGTVANLEALVRARARTSLWLALGTRLEKNLAPKTTLFEMAHLGWERFDQLIDPRIDQTDDLNRWSFTEGNPWEVGRNLEESYGVSFRGPVVLVPQNKHYSWPKGVSILGMGEEAFWPVQLDHRGKMSIRDLQRQLERARREQRPVLAVVSVAGTTEMAEFDPIHEVQDLLDRWKREYGIHIWHHVDAAYGGFFRTLDRADRTLVHEKLALSLEGISRSDSVTLDPHKLGYVPYASGSFLTRSRRDYFVKGFNAPYLQYEKMKDRGPFTIEGSRSAAGAVATWVTARTIGLNPEGYGRVLGRTVRIKRELEELLSASGLPVRIAPHTDTNVMCFAIALPDEPLSASNRRTESIYQAFSPESGAPFYVSKTRLNWKSYSEYLNAFVRSWNAEVDTDELVLVRICLMNPFFSSKETAVRYPEEFIKALREKL